MRMGMLGSLVMGLMLSSARHYADTGTCGGQMVTLPFNDVMSSLFFCQIAEAFFLGPHERHVADYLQPVNSGAQGTDGL